MVRRFRPPLVAVAFVLLALVALLATLQFRWLGQISQAERERMRATLGSGAAAFAQDVDRELTRAYLLFQMDPADEEDLARRVGGRYDQWQATARFPAILKTFYVFSPGEGGGGTLQRFDPASRMLEAADWPPSMANWRERLLQREVASGDPSVKTLFIAHLSEPIWDEASAIVAPMASPLLRFPHPGRGAGFRTLEGELPLARVSYAILTLDLDYIRTEMLPVLAERHFGRGPGDLDYQVVVVRGDDTRDVVYASTPLFAPSPDAPADASVDFFQVRAQDFGTVAAEVRRFAALLRRAPPGEREVPAEEPRAADVLTLRERRPVSIFVQTGIADGAGEAAATLTETRVATRASPRWKLMLRHPSGSLEAAVDSARRRNLLVSSSVLGVLGVSIGLLVLSTRRAQRLARQQMEFVAAVSHELRTPLAVIRSAADNLAEGVVSDEEQVRKYGALMRGEGRRLTEMVEQILELSGIQSGQRGFALRAVAVAPLVREVLEASASLVQDAGVRVEESLPPDLPPVLGDEPALRRVLQNLIGNAIKYGARGGWIGVSAAAAGSEVRITVADGGMGIPPAEQARVFEPFYRASDAVAAQIPGAGLGLSLVLRIVEAHGGRVSLTSAPGQGSAFTVHLPGLGSGRESTVFSRSDPSGPADIPPRSRLAEEARYS